MENRTEYILIKEITSKENRKNTLKFFGLTLLSGLFGIGLLYFLMYFILWADRISNTIVGYF
jgi:hypothetical protein